MFFKVCYLLLVFNDFQFVIERKKYTNDSQQKNHKFEAKLNDYFFLLHFKQPRQTSKTRINNFDVYARDRANARSAYTDIPKHTHKNEIEVKKMVQKEK